MRQLAGTNSPRNNSLGLFFGVLEDPCTDSPTPTSPVIFSSVGPPLVLYFCMLALLFEEVNCSRLLLAYRWLTSNQGGAPCAQAMI
jgi:hypothetical protein